MKKPPGATYKCLADVLTDKAGDAFTANGATTIRTSMSSSGRVQRCVRILV
ncbi:MAG TPA: hypothetical protein VMW22_05975 [Candidatus Desulfaltia sp.]|nr:hypothetical protein [Candidatus Desulfaltia sp.]